MKTNRKTPPAPLRVRVEIGLLDWLVFSQLALWAGLLFWAMGVAGAA